MDFENSPSLPNAHQQIRLGDVQLSARKWTTAIEYYLRAIEYFKVIQKSLRDDNLISTIQAQIVQCEKTIYLCRLKDRTEQALKAERHSTIVRAHSTSNTKTSEKVNRIMPRHHTEEFNKTVTVDGRNNNNDSFAAIAFPNTTNSEELTKLSSSIIAKKNRKDDSQKLEELKMSYEALKSHLKTAFDDIEKLKNENNQLRLQNEIISSQSIEFSLLSTSHEDKDHNGSD